MKHPSASFHGARKFPSPVVADFFFMGPVPIISVPQVNVRFGGVQGLPNEGGQQTVPELHLQKCRVRKPRLSKTQSMDMIPMVSV